MTLVIRLFAAKGPFDFVIKFMILMLLVNALNVAQALYFDQGRFMPLTNYVRGGVVVATPFIILVIWLISSLDNLQSRLKLMLRTDQMTGLLQRLAFMDTVGALHADRGGVFLMLDVDHFKTVNDRFGHSVGDDCLIAIARLVRELTRRDDVVGRLGGEEFGVFLVGAPDTLAVEIGERLAHGIEIAVADLGLQVRVTMSVGAVRGAARDTVQQVYRTADQALYRAKAQGRARLVFDRSTDPPAAAPVASGPFAPAPFGQAPPLAPLPLAPLPLAPLPLAPLPLAPSTPAPPAPAPFGSAPPLAAPPSPFTPAPSTALLHGPATGRSADLAPADADCPTARGLRS